MSAPPASLSEGIEILRSSGAAMEFEPELLATLANCLYRTGDVDRSIEIARDAIAIARTRKARLAGNPRERHAWRRLADVRRAPGARDEAVTLFDGAERLIRETGAHIHDRKLREARSLLGVSVTS